MTKHSLKVADGSSLPIADHFGEPIFKAFGKIPSEDESLGFIKQLLTISEMRRLTNGEREQLNRATDVKNMHRAWRWLGGRDIKDVFGPDATICQVHGNSMHMQCGCVLQIAFDHHKRHGEHDHIPHYPEYVCAEHPMEAHPSFREHHAHVVAANQKA